MLREADLCRQLFRCPERGINGCIEGKGLQRRQGAGIAGARA